MTNPTFQCGLDGDFESYPELTEWLAKAQTLADAVASMRPRFWRVERAGSMQLPCLVETDGQQRLVRRLVVIHPLWRADLALTDRLGVTVPNTRTLPIDTFDLERRPLRALEMVDEMRPAPSFRANAAN